MAIELTSPPHHGTAQETGARGISVMVRLTGRVLSVRVEGELDMASVADFEESLAPYDDRADHYSFFLGGVSFIDVVGWKAIARKCEGHRGRVVTSSPAVRRFIRLALGVAREM